MFVYSSTSKKKNQKRIATKGIFTSQSYSSFFVTFCFLKQKPKKTLGFIFQLEALFGQKPFFLFSRKDSAFIKVRKGSLVSLGCSFNKQAYNAFVSKLKVFSSRREDQSVVFSGDLYSFFEVELESTKFV